MNSLSCRAKISNGAQLADLQFTKCSKIYDAEGPTDDEYQRLKAEQSSTSDMPLQAMPVEMRSGIYAAITASARKQMPLPASPFAKNPALHLTRTASALAGHIHNAQQEIQTFTEQAMTMGALPAFGSARASLHAQQARPNTASASTPRRQLLPAPKTAFLPAGDPCELRTIVEKVQAKRSETIERARLSSTLQSISAAHPTLCRQDDDSLLAKLHSVLSTDIGLLVIGPSRRAAAQLAQSLRRLIDKLAVA